MEKAKGSQYDLFLENLASIIFDLIANAEVAS